MAPIVECAGDLYAVYPVRGRGRGGAAGAHAAWSRGGVRRAGAERLGQVDAAACRGTRTALRRDGARCGPRAIGGPRAAAGALPAEMLGYADQHYWRALGRRADAEELVGVHLGLAAAPAGATRRAASCSSASGWPAARRQAGRALRRRAAARRALRRRGARASPPHRRRATGELDCETAQQVYDAGRRARREGTAARPSS